MCKRHFMRNISCSRRVRSTTLSTGKKRNEQSDVIILHNNFIWCGSQSVRLHRCTSVPLTILALIHFIRFGTSDPLKTLIVFTERQTHVARRG